MAEDLIPLKPRSHAKNWVLDRTKALDGPRTQAYGETNYLVGKTRFWTESRHCMVLGFKPMGKPTTWMRKTEFWTEPRHCMVLGPKPMRKPTTWMKKNWVLDRTKALHGPRTQAYGETNYLDEEN